MRALPLRHLPEPAALAGDVDPAPAGRTVPVVALVPTEAVLFRSVRLPRAWLRSRLERLVPNALEDELAEDIDGLVFAVGRQGANGEVPVAVARQADVAAWEAVLQGDGQVTERLVPDLYCLPEPADGWQVAVQGGRAVVRTGRHAGFAAETQALPVLLERHLGDGAGRPPLQVHGVADGDRLLVELAGSGWTVQRHAASPLDAASLPPARNEWLAFASRRATPRGAAGITARAWIPAAVLLAMGATLDAGLTIRRTAALDAQTQALRESAEARFREAFPDITRVVAMETQAAQALAELRRRAGAGPDRFLGLLATLAEALGATPAARLEAFRYAGADLDITLGLPDAGTVERLRADLATRSVDVAVLSIASRQGVAQAQLRLAEVSK